MDRCRHNTVGLWVALQSLSFESLKRDEGQTLAEYAMILALVALAVVGAVMMLGGKISGLFSKVGSQI
jgi:pilus assembly protein Flp/PilA